jgi:hypothetical protein
VKGVTGTIDGVAATGVGVVSGISITTAVPAGGENDAGGAP